MSKERFAAFTDDELYMLKRQAIESSFNIVMMGNYNDKEKEMHTTLLNEIIEARRKTPCFSYGDIRRSQR